MTSSRTLKNYFIQIMVFRREGSILVIFEIFIAFVKPPLLKWKFQRDLISSGPQKQQMMKQSGGNCPTVYGWLNEWINWGYSVQESVCKSAEIPIRATDGLNNIHGSKRVLASSPYLRPVILRWRWHNFPFGTNPGSCHTDVPFE